VRLVGATGYDIDIRREQELDIARATDSESWREQKTFLTFETFALFFSIDIKSRNEERFQKS